MSFFKKLRDRMFRSSSKLSEGLDAVVAEGADATAAAPEATPQETAAPPRPGLMARLAGEPRAMFDDAMLERLEEVLIAADMGAGTAARVAANIAEGRLGRRVAPADLRAALVAEVARIMEPVARPLPLYPKRPQVVLIVGVNGSGKTTTIGKLAAQFRAAGKRVVIAAGDTFRAAAVEQLRVWGERNGVTVVAQGQDADPAAVIFDALQSARARGLDLLIADTAGRLHTQQGLMAELSKIGRVLAKLDASAPHEVLMVIDGTTGQNAVNQVRQFLAAAKVSGLVVTKLDGSAKGGVVFALAREFGLPIRFVGLGEQLDDLREFDPEAFVDALLPARLGADAPAA